MAAINANIVVETTTLTVSPTTNTLGVTVDPINLNVFASGFAPAGGNNQEIQFNNNGALGGVANTSFASGNLTFTNLANLKINGGVNAYYLQTDGAGSLTWAAGGTPTGSGVPSGANTQIQLSDGSGTFDSGAGFTFDNVSNIFTAPGNINSTSGVFNGDGGGLSNISVPKIANGTSNVDIATSDGNITMVTNGVTRATVSSLGIEASILTGDLTLNDNYINLGQNAGITTPPTFGVAVGSGAGEDSQGANSVAIGTKAGNTSQADNSIILNATGANLTTSTTDSFVVKPIRENISTTKVLYYNVTTGEITSDSAPDTTKINNGSSNVTIPTLNGNIDYNVGGANIGRMSTGLLAINGNITAETDIESVTGNILATAGNIVATAGNIDATAGIFNGDGGGLSNVAIGNIAGLGNIATINLNGVATQYLNGAGAFDVVGVANTANFLVVASNGALNIGSNSAIQLSGAIAIGKDAAGNTTFAQGANGVALGQEAAFTGQDQGAIAIGYRAGYTQQESYSVAVGYQAGQDTQAINSVAVGRTAGSTTQGANAIAVGYNAASTSQGANSVAIGTTAGQDTQSANAVAVGSQAGLTTQGSGGTAIGYNAGRDTQGVTAVAVGHFAQGSNAGDNAIGVGVSAGRTDQGDQAISIGALAGFDTQGTYGIAIGHSAGQNNQGANAVAIGHDAGVTSQATNSIIINATGAALDTTTADTFNVKPVRNAGTSGLPTGFFQVAYNPTTGEFVYYS